MITNRDKQIMIACSNKGMSLSKIGKLFGLDHTTVLYHLKNPNRTIQKRGSKGGHNIKNKSLPQYTTTPDLTTLGLSDIVLKKISPKVRQTAFIIKEPKFVSEYKNYSYKQITRRQKKVNLVRDEIGNIVK